MNKVPILFIAFNRLDVVKEAFPYIVNYAPDHLMISLDGPRNDVPGESIVVKKVENYLRSLITWKCDVTWLVSEHNKGCGRAVNVAIDSFFNRFEFGIILEDDCKPSDEFFRFCAQNRDIRDTQPNLGCICGTRFIDFSFGPRVNHLSNFPMIWGWASWSDVWKMHRNRKVGSHRIHTNVPSFVKKNYSKTVKGLVDTWDYQWIYSFYILGKKALIPACSIVYNIGFNAENSTHTRSDKSDLIKVCDNVYPTRLKTVFRLSPQYEFTLKHFIFRDNLFWTVIRFLKSL